MLFPQNCARIFSSTFFANHNSIYIACFTSQSSVALFGGYARFTSEYNSAAGAIFLIGTRIYARVVRKIQITIEYIQ